MRRLEQEDWWEELVSLKDELSLRELAERFNATPSAISNALRRNRLERRPAPSGPRAYRTTRNDSVYKLTRSISQVNKAEPLVRPGSKDSLLQPAFHLLGKLPDAEIAERCGVSVRTVASYRARHKIAGYTGPRKRQGPGKKMHQSKIDTYASLVGIESDKEIARRAGVTPNAVRHYRMTRGIVPVTQVAAPATSAVSRVASETFGWLVRFDDADTIVERVMLGSSLEQVAQNAMNAGLGVVVGIQRKGVYLGAPEVAG